MPVTEGFEVERNVADEQGNFQGEAPPPPSSKAGEFSVRIKGDDQSKEFSMPLNPRSARGMVEHMVLSIKNKLGTQPVTVDFELFDTDEPAEMIASSDKSIFRLIVLHDLRP